VTPNVGITEQSSEESSLHKVKIRHKGCSEGNASLQEIDNRKKEEENIANQRSYRDNYLQLPKLYSADLMW